MMLFKQQLDPKKTKPVALCLLVVGLLMVCCGTAWQHVFASLFHLSVNQGDFLHGFSIGLGLTLEIIALAQLAALNRRRID
jgi:uncharacterized protein YjeT (DUF2065 family)